MKHNLFVEGMKAKRNLPLNFGLKGAGCPYGTVPIIRINKDDLARAKMLSTIYSSNIDEEPGHHVSIIFLYSGNRLYLFIFLVSESTLVLLMQVT
jgi:hypothetical protein